MLPVRLSEQLQPGTFEHTINYLVDEEIDLSVFDSRYCDDETGSPAYDPAVLLKASVVPPPSRSPTPVGSSAAARTSRRLHSSSAPAGSRCRACSPTC
jgi:hypothetical protein